VRRFEVFTGEGRRRKWSLADKIALVAEMAAAGNVSELARRHGMRPSQLFTWRRELRYAAEATTPPPFVPAVVEPVPVAVAGEVPSSTGRRRSRRARGPAPAVELDIDGVSVKISRGADAQVIAAVIEALKITR
jgi:transposase